MHRNASRFSLICSSVIVLFTSSIGAFGQEKPKSFSVKRYSVIWQNSFFGQVSPPKTTIDFSVEWSLSGVFSFNGGHGAVIVNQANGEMEQIENHKYNESGLKLLDVLGAKGDDPEGMRIQVKAKSGQVFWVTNISHKKDLAYRVISSTSKVVSDKE